MMAPNILRPCRHVVSLCGAAKRYKGASVSSDDIKTIDLAENDDVPCSEPAELDAAEQAALEEQARIEKEEREAQEREARRAADAAAREERAKKAVETLAGSAGFVGRAGVYYDVAQAHTPHAAAEQKPEQASEGEEEAPRTETLVEHFEAAGYDDPAAFARKVARVTEAVVKHPLHRELMYKTLAFCLESRDLNVIEEKIATFPGFKKAATSQYHLIEVLENAGGLERFELDEEGDLVTPDRKKGLTEDEIDDLVWSYAFMTTPAGAAVVEQHTPRARIIELLGLVPDRKEPYIDLLDFCSQEPRTYNEICGLLTGRPSLVRLIDGEPQVMQPSVFVDKLEAAGGMEWRDGWVLTEEGRAYLEELREM